MIPPTFAFEKLMQEAGVNNNSAIVIVSKGAGNGDMTMATRVYWQLKYFGHDNMAILNGGMGQWLVDGRKISSSKEKVSKGNWKATAERKEILATSEDVVAAVKAKGQLMDTRALSLYLGTWRKKSYVYANGHIPGAKNFPNELLTNPTAPANSSAGTFSGLEGGHSWHSDPLPSLQVQRTRPWPMQLLWQRAFP